ncbi:MAG TPA: DivIVA domain-containing protein [Thermoleophilaceae bacterium]
MAAEKRQPAQPEATPRTAKPAPEEFDELRDHVPADIRNVQFPVSVRGYDRDAVETYVKRVNHVIAELEVSRSPRAAVRHALDRVGKQTVAVLQEARESADKLLEAARDEADAEKERAKAEAAKLVVNASDEADRTKAEADQVFAEAKAQASEIVAEAQADAEKRKQQADTEITAAKDKADARMREVQSDTEAVWNERGRLLEETQAMAQKLQDLAAGAASRLVDDQSEQQTMVTEPQPRQRESKPGPPS